jgi:hypothetical protein
VGRGDPLPSVLLAMVGTAVTEGPTGETLIVAASAGIQPVESGSVVVELTVDVTIPASLGVGITEAGGVGNAEVEPNWL